MFQVFTNMRAVWSLDTKRLHGSLSRVKFGNGATLRTWRGTGAAGAQLHWPRWRMGALLLVVISVTRKKTRGCGVAGNGMPTMCAISWRASPVCFSWLSRMHHGQCTGLRCTQNAIPHFKCHRASVTQPCCSSEEGGRGGGRCCVLLKDTSAGRMRAEPWSPGVEGAPGTLLALRSSWCAAIGRRKTRISFWSEERLNGAAETVRPRETCHCSPVTSGPVFTPSF